jgi:hypothetical protein
MDHRVDFVPEIPEKNKKLTTKNKQNTPGLRLEGGKRVLKNNQAGIRMSTQPLKLRRPTEDRGHIHDTSGSG